LLWVEELSLLKVFLLYEGKEFATKTAALFFIAVLAVKVIIQ